MTEWKEYTGSDEQIAEIWNHYNGFLLNTTDKILTKDDFKDSVSFVEYLKQGVTSYWLIPYDPLREMKIRQARTGQPVWMRRPTWMNEPNNKGQRWIYHEPTCKPNWYLPDTEYSLTPFEEEV